MKLTLLGTACGMPDIDRNPSAVLVETQDGTYLLDAGEGTARQLVRFGVSADKVDTVFVSHTHPDHAAGITGILQWMHLCGRTKPLSLFFPEGVLRRFKSVFPAFQIVQGNWSFKFRSYPISGGIVLEKDVFRIEAVPNSHLAPGRTYEEQLKSGLDSYSFCMIESADKKAVVTADVDGLDHLNACAPMTNLLVSECTHVDPDDVLQFAKLNRIGRVALTHIPARMKIPDLSDAERKFGVAVRFANDGDAFEV
jgi:ribonuclease BN (tRNA processing enzyme)